MSHPNTGLSFAERFEMKVDRSGECHRWTGCKGPTGYGNFRYEGRLRRAHAVALLLAGIDVPPGMTVDHVWTRGCRHKDCVRVDHLEVVPLRVNILRSNGTAARNARKTHCASGHEFTPANTNVRNGWRNCRACDRDRRRRRREQAAA